MAKKPLKKVQKMPTRTVDDIVNELTVLRDRKKDIDNREKELKEQLGTILEGEGIKDSKGSFKLIVGDKLATKQARKSVKLNIKKAEKYFKEINIWDAVKVVKEEIDEDLVAQAVVDRKLTLEELEELSDVKTTYAITITDYKPEDEEMPNVVVS